MHADQIESRLDARDAKSVDDLRRQGRELILGSAGRSRVTSCAADLTLVHARRDPPREQRDAENAAARSALERGLERRGASGKHGEFGRLGEGDVLAEQLEIA